MSGQMKKNADCMTHAETTVGTVPDMATDAPKHVSAVGTFIPMQNPCPMDLHWMILNRNY